jgi:hypothetical protein
LLNIHDEIISICFNQRIGDAIEQIVKETINSFKKYVPLIKMEWKRRLKSWAEK